MDDRYPEWARQLYGWLPVSPQVVLTGRVDDQHPVPTSQVGGTTPGDAGRPGPSAGGPKPYRLLHTSDVVAECLRQRGFPLVIGWNPLLGVTTLYEERTGEGDAFVAGAVGQGNAIEILNKLIAAVAGDDPDAPPSRRVGLVIHSAPRLTPSLDHDQINTLYARARELAIRARQYRFPTDQMERAYNTIVWAVSQESDLPHWLVAAQGVRVISIPETTIATRRRAAEVGIDGLPGYDALDDETRSRVLDRLASQTAGMSITETMRTIPVARDRNIPAAEIDSAVRFVRSGVPHSPWREPELRSKIAQAEKHLDEKVKGQASAVHEAVSILARAALGLSGAQAEGHPTRPQGVMFFAGPTGSGKTELAKQIAQLVFGREEAMIRFDMSEFAAEENQARLIGAPPGYVGFGGGGELTNAVRRNPFSLLLFDEIEKAHPVILDKFLQILEDGRLTDGSGNTVHFTETLIVFTSNMGIHRRRDPRDPHSELVRNVNPGDDYTKIRTTILNAIKSEFTQLKRPELLNRIGEESIIVFNFLSPEVACKLIDDNLITLRRQIYSRTGIEITIDSPVNRALYEEAVKPDNLAFGGRRMKTLVESWVVNPLALHLISRPAGPVTVKNLEDRIIPGDPPIAVRDVVLS